jgi:hypothetical protein
MTNDKPAPKVDKTEEELERQAQLRMQRLARETLTGDVRDIILNDMKDRANALPWNLSGEKEQQEVIEHARRIAEHLVHRVVEIVAAGGRQVIQAQLEKITIKDGITATLELSQHNEQRHRLYDAQGSTVMIIVAEKEPFEGERAPVAINRPQKEMFDGGDGAPANKPPEEGGEAAAA